MHLAPVELQQAVRGVRLPGMESRDVWGAEGCRDGCSGELKQPVHHPGPGARQVDSRQCEVEDPVAGRTLTVSPEKGQESCQRRSLQSTRPVTRSSSLWRRRSPESKE